MRSLCSKKYRAGVLIATLSASILLSACQKEIYRNLSEQDANQMMMVLLQAGIDAEKSTPDSGKTLVLVADENQIAAAMEVLRARGLPQEKFSDLGEIFKKEGLVSTPTQERVRFIYGVSQELSRTLSEIDGVITARVHIVLPNNDPLAQRIQPSSASIFIKYRPEANVASLVSQIKNLVAHSVEGLTYEQVSVTTVAGEAVNSVVPKKSSATWYLVLAAILGGLLVTGGGLYLWWRMSAEDSRVRQVAARYVIPLFNRILNRSNKNTDKDKPAVST